MDKRMFDFEGFYRRMAIEMPENARMVEVGVAEGSSAIFLAEEMLNLGKDKFHLLMVDSLSYGGSEQLSNLIRHVTAAKLGQWVEILPFDTLVACTRFPDCTFDFVFLDSSHLVEPTKAEIREWFQKVKEDGILAGHDYNNKEGVQVRAAVDIVVPQVVVRPPIQNCQYAPEIVLHTEETPKHLGVWWLRKKFYVKLN
jgi:SAM-dependent methyltransferase